MIAVGEVRYRTLTRGVRQSSLRIGIHLVRIHVRPRARRFSDGRRRLARAGRNRGFAPTVTAE
jgi:hypothetical protein